MKNDNQSKLNKIVKYLNGEMAEDELKSFMLWLADENNQKLFKEYTITNHYVQLSKNEFDHEKAFSSFLKETKEDTIYNISWKKKTFNYLKYAAVFVGILISSLLVYEQTNVETDQSYKQVTLELNDGSVRTIKENDSFKELIDEKGVLQGIQVKTKLVYSKAEEDNKKDEISKNTLRVPYGKKFQLVLSDGTEIYINSGSTLTFPCRFAKNQPRIVELEGEAYFKVAKDKNAAFVVATKGIHTEVFGTEFNVSSYSNDAFSNVVLVEGSVGIFNNKDRFDANSDIYLKPNQKASLIKTNKSIQITDVKVGKYIAWVDGKLVFQNEKFESIMKKLERFYDVSIVINYEDIKQEKFTGQFDVENIQDVLNTFKSNTFFNYKTIGKQIMITP